MFLFQVNHSFLTQLPGTNTSAYTDPRKKPTMTVIGLEHEIDNSLFLGGKANIRCTADLFNVYKAQGDYIFEQERPKPRPSSVLQNNNESSSGKVFVKFCCKHNTYVIFTGLIRIKILGKCHITTPASEYLISRARGFALILLWKLGATSSHSTRPPEILYNLCTRHVLACTPHHVRIRQRMRHNAVRERCA